MANGQLSNVGCEAVASREPTMQDVQNSNYELRDRLQSLDMLFNKMEDVLYGPRPEKLQQGEADAPWPPGIVHTLARLGIEHNETITVLHRRLERIATSIGVAE